MSAYRRRYLRKGVSHAMWTYRRSHCGINASYAEWSGEESEKTRKINSENRRCKTCVRVAGDGW